jgi:hypothetical protein
MGAVASVRVAPVPHLTHIPCTPAQASLHAPTLHLTLTLPLCSHDALYAEFIYDMAEDRENEALATYQAWMMDIKTPSHAVQAAALLHGRLDDVPALPPAHGIGGDLAAMSEVCASPICAHKPAHAQRAHTGLHMHMSSSPPQCVSCDSL